MISFANGLPHIPITFRQTWSPEFIHVAKLSGKILSKVLKDLRLCGKLKSLKEIKILRTASNDCLILYVNLKTKRKTMKMKMNKKIINNNQME